MGHAMIQCQNHKSQDTKSACKWVTVKVIRPVAVNDVINCVSNSCMCYLRIRRAVSANSEREAAAQKFQSCEAAQSASAKIGRDFLVAPRDSIYGALRCQRKLLNQTVCVQYDSVLDTSSSIDQHIRYC